MSQERRKKLLEYLEKEEKAVSASWFAKELGVTRQVIVGDVALLRASGVDIIATPRGYLLHHQEEKLYVVACEHGSEQMAEELYTVVDCGCGILDVTVEHPLYGQITCNLQIYTRAEADDFMERFRESGSRPLSEITRDIHLHRLHCPSEGHYENVVKALGEKGLLRVDD